MSNQPKAGEDNVKPEGEYLQSLRSSLAHFKKQGNGELAAGILLAINRYKVMCPATPSPPAREASVPALPAPDAKIKND